MVPHQECDAFRRDEGIRRHLLTLTLTLIGMKAYTGIFHHWRAWTRTRKQGRELVAAQERVELEEKLEEMSFHLERSFVGTGWVILDRYMPPQPIRVRVRVRIRLDGLF